MIEDNSDLWWVTGGSGGGATSEMYHASINRFLDDSYIPKQISFHNLINVNNTHTVMLGGSSLTDQTYIFDS